MFAPPSTGVRKGRIADVMYGTCMSFDDIDMTKPFDTKKYKDCMQKRFKRRDLPEAAASETPATRRKLQ